MMEQESHFSVGEWVVHRQYGVGQIKKTEEMPIHGKQIECFKVQVRDGAFWFPTNEVENPRIRPVASQEIISKVSKNLRRKPGSLDQDKKYWNQQIKEIPLDSDLETISKLIRDLSAQKTLKRLNDTQLRALSKFEERLLFEWSAITGVDIEEIRTQFNKLLSESKAKIDVD
jgi:RNA polymerase-interacting CarD/CdnL/TRCF family regulator